MPKMTGTGRRSERGQKEFGEIPSTLGTSGERAMVLIQLLLPTTGAATTQDTSLAETRRELAERFTGVTAYVRAPAKGLWTAPDGQTEQDDVVMVEVVTDTFDRSWWRSYSATLAERFHQEKIHIRAVPVEMLDEDGI